MFTRKIDYRRLARFILSVIAGLIVLAATHGAVWAEGHTFILSASSDYGAADCFGKEQGCSEVVASAFENRAAIQHPQPTAAQAI